MNTQASELTAKRISKASEAYRLEFFIYPLGETDPSDEMRAWWERTAPEDRLSLVEYWEGEVEKEREWRRKVYADYQARKVAA